MRQKDGRGRSVLAVALDSPALVVAESLAQLGVLEGELLVGVAELANLREECFVFGEELADGVFHLFHFGFLAVSGGLGSNAIF